MKELNLLAALTLLLFVSCKQSSEKETKAQKGDIVETIINDDKSFYHVNFNTYPSNDISLPIGVLIRVLAD